MLVRLLLIVAALLFIVLTALPLVRHDWWVIRACDFPRLQIVVAGGAILSAYLGVLGLNGWLETSVLAGLGAAVVYQVFWIWPYTPYAAPQVLTATDPHPAARLSVLVANVWAHNRDGASFLRYVREVDPDVVLVLECTPHWAEHLGALDDAYPHRLCHPREDPYGIALLARHPLHDASVRFLVDDTIPSVHAIVELPNEQAVRFIGLHPRPPHPEEDRDTIHRDAELLLVAHQVEEWMDDGNGPVVVAGDFNDVPWSYVTLMMRRISGLLDPRIGRGPYNTFHTRYPFFRCPIDHVLHSAHFSLRRLERGPDVGSDHYPFLADLQLEPHAVEVHERPYANDTMRRHARQEIYKSVRRQ